MHTDRQGRPVVDVVFAADSAVPNDTALRQVDLLRWALSRGGGRALLVEGGASLRKRHGAALAQARAQAVATLLATDGRSITTPAAAPPGQSAAERQADEASFRAVHVQPWP